MLDRARYWIDNKTVFEGTYSLDGLREHDQVSVVYYVHGPNRIATHVRLLELQ